MLKIEHLSVVKYPLTDTEMDEIYGSKGWRLACTELEGMMIRYRFTREVRDEDEDKPAW